MLNYKWGGKKEIIIIEMNIQLRSKILEYSLKIENTVNTLLLLNLGIFDGGKATRLFGNKASISFKNKIDLLYDINVLTKSENSDLELIMIFRNKFLHDINCDSFLKVLEMMENGIKNKFKVFLKRGESIDNEDACKTACLNLYLKNLNTINNKIKEWVIQIDARNDIFQQLSKQVTYHYDLFGDLTNSLLLILKNSDLEDENIRNLGVIISAKIETTLDKLKTDESYLNVKNKLEFFKNNPKILNDYLSFSRGIKSNKTIEINNRTDQSYQL